MDTVGPLYPWTPNCGSSKTVQVLTEKYPGVSGLTHFKPVLFKGQLYSTMNMYLNN